MSLFKKATRRAKGASPLAVGLVILLGVVVFGAVVFTKTQILTFLSFGPEVKAEFAKGYKMQPYHSKVKIADVVVGTVTSSEETEHGTALVTMTLDRGTLDKLGEKPSAAITATTLLGGTYYVDLVPGGTGRFNGGTIPIERTKTPVELGDVLTAFTPDALKAVPGTIGRLDRTLTQGGRDSIRDLLDDAPSSLQPAGEVLTAVRGTRPDNDLTEVVNGLRTTAASALKNQGQLGSLFAGLRGSTAALSAGARSLADSVRTSPETLRATRTGLTDVRGTLHKLTDRAEELQPTARQLSSLLDDADPVLHRARPVISDLREVLHDARPLVDRLNPTVDDGTHVLRNLDGPVLNSLRGPIASAVNNPWHGTGVYKNGGSPNKGYEELAYTAVNGAFDWQTHDANGAQGRLAAGGGGQSVGGAAFPNTTEEYLEALGLGGPPGPEADRPGKTVGQPFAPPGVSKAVPSPGTKSLPMMGNSANPAPAPGGNASDSLPLGVPR
jgi:phospholipid/cholesterol/gamma-HCH transport system substrate-binding protein